jgi:hypothetical protein
MREQVASGALVIRQMTHAERSASAKQVAAFDAKLTPKERSKRDAALRERRRRSAYNS